MGILSKHCENGTSADLEHLLMDMGFDIVSDLTFGKSWDMLSSGKRHPIIEEFQMGKKVVGFIIQSMWIFHIIKMIPPVNNRIQFWMDYYGELLQKRKEMTDMTADFYTHISTVQGWEKDGAFDAQLAIIAGADTVSITLSNIFHSLAHDISLQERLQEELDPLFAPGQKFAHDQDLAGKPLLNGIIHESLRLHPPVPGGLQRVTPPEGATIAGKYVPGDTIVTTPTYSLQRDKRAFVKPDEFIPERWSSQPELILRKDAFVPFSYGTYNCTGRPLAMMQLRMVTVMVSTS
jgi:tryprostatin B 6-hydroxylase